MSGSGTFHDLPFEEDGARRDPPASNVEVLDEDPSRGRGAGRARAGPGERLRVALEGLEVASLRSDLVGEKRLLDHDLADDDGVFEQARELHRHPDLARLERVRRVEPRGIRDREAQNRQLTVREGDVDRLDGHLGSHRPGEELFRGRLDSERGLDERGDARLREVQGRPGGHQQQQDHDAGQFNRALQSAVLGRTCKPGGECSPPVRSGCIKLAPARFAGERGARPALSQGTPAS